jgi:hypothetical protein
MLPSPVMGDADVIIQASKLNTIRPGRQTSSGNCNSILFARSRFCLLLLLLLDVNFRCG